MVDELINIYEYEQILMGQRKNFSLSFRGSLEERKREVGNIWRYAVEELLHWTPEAALKNFDNKIVDSLLLNKTFKALDFDREHSYITDYRFILQYAFPDRIKYDKYTEAIAEYERFAKLGKWSNDKSKYKHPKRFFTDIDGMERAGYCLRYAINLFMGDMDMYEKYLFFANTAQANKWLKKKGLNEPVKLIYLSPLNYYHKTAPSKDRDDFLFNALMLRNEISGVKIESDDEDIEDDE